MVLSAIQSLAPWPAAGDLSDEEWDRYLAVAREVQRADPAGVERAIAAALENGYDSQVFLLLRVLFDLPERAPADERRTYVGWVNWPASDADGTVSLSWPVSWRNGRPRLVEPYVGFEGEPYAGVEDYRYLRGRYPVRELPA